MNRTDFLNQSAHLVPIETLSLLDSIKEPFSEQQILLLQEKFLTNGFQYIKVKNIMAGRNIIQLFLDSLGVYHDIAAITLSNMRLPNYITHVYRELANEGFLDPFGQQYLDDYFIDNFYFDFVWIEATQELFNSSHWFNDFQDKLMSFKINEHIPIIVVSYDD